MCACALLTSLAALAAPPIDKTKKPPTAAQIAAWVRQLGDDRFEHREAASRALARAGEPALDAVRAAAASKDPEVRRRAAQLMRSLRKHAVAREVARLKGEWVLCGSEHGGHKSGVTTTQPARFEVRSTGLTYHHPSGGGAWKVTLIDTPDGVGKADFALGAETYWCRYRVEGDRLLVAWPSGYWTNGNGWGACGRPRSLKTRSGDSFEVLIFERPKPSPEPPAPPRAGGLVGPVAVLSPPAFVP